MVLSTKHSVEDSDIDSVTHTLRQSNESFGFRPREHPVTYDAEIVDNYHNLLRKLPVAKEWPPAPAEMVTRLQQLPHGPNAPQHTLRCGFRNPRDTRFAHVWAKRTHFVNRGGKRVLLDDARYSVGYGQHLAKVQLETLEHTSALLMPALPASKAKPLHAVSSGGQRAPNISGPGHHMNCTYRAIPLTEGDPIALLAHVLVIWELIEEEPRLHLENGRTEFQLVILDRPPDETDGVPQYPSLPIPRDAFVLMSVIVSQLAAGQPDASMNTDVPVAWGWPQQDAAKLIASLLVELSPFGFDSSKEFEEAVARHRREAG